MSFDPLTAILDIGGKVIDRVFPDPVAAATAKLELIKQGQAGELQEIQAALQQNLAQAATNTEEAKSDSTFVAGWRPFIGWICGSGLAMNYVVAPLAEFLSGLFGHHTDFPRLDLSELIPLVSGMLGLAVTRSYDKKKVLDTSVKTEGAK